LRDAHTREVARMTARIPALRHPPADAVMLSTIHSAKGLEWDTVFLARLEDSTLPSQHADTEEAEEEPRIAYVCMTRPRFRLGITYAAEQ
jgi:DNA helicase II / ATP-dependent DNA helicase PcrA